MASVHERDIAGTSGTPIRCLGGALAQPPVPNGSREPRPSSVDAGSRIAVGLHADRALDRARPHESQTVAALLGVARYGLAARQAFGSTDLLNELPRTPSTASQLPPFNDGDALFVVRHDRRPRAGSKQAAHPLCNFQPRTADTESA